MSASELEKIEGIGPGFSNKLIGLDVEHLEDIAHWSDAEIDAMDGKLKANGAIVKQDWRGQARKLLGLPPYQPGPDELADVAGEAPEPLRAPPPQTAKSAPAPQMDVSAIVAAAGDQENPLAALNPEQLAFLTAMVDKAKAFNAKLEAPAPRRPRGKTYRKLDRNKQYASITGNFHGAHFSENFKGETFYFDHEGKEIPWDRTKDVPLPASVLQDADFEDDHDLDMDDARYMHVLNYLDRKVDYPIALVKKAVKDLYGKVVKDEKEARLFLHFIRRTPGL